MKPSLVLKVAVPMLLLSALAVPSHAAYDFFMQIKGATQGQFQGAVATGAYAGASSCASFIFVAFPTTEPATKTEPPRVTFEAAGGKSYSGLALPPGANEAMVLLDFDPQVATQLLKAWSGQEALQVLLTYVGTGPTAAAGTRTFTIAAAKIRSINFLTAILKGGGTAPRVSIRLAFASVADSAGLTPAIPRTAKPLLVKPKLKIKPGTQAPMPMETPMPMDTPMPMETPMNM